MLTRTRAGGKTCLVCKTPLSAIEAQNGVLCGNAICSWKYNAVPALQRCMVCGRALTTEQIASRTCAEADCRRASLVDLSIEFKRERRERLEREAIRLRDAVAPHYGIADSASYTLAIVPHNYAKGARLPARRKHKLREHLHTVLANAITHRDAVSEGTEPAHAPLPPLAPPPAPVAAVLLRACIGCRGYCCRTGGEHAYITARTMESYLDAHPGVSRDDVVNDYMSYVPERSLTDGCVYQGVKGCVLPRSMRGDTCNRFFCNALKQYQEALPTHEEPRAFFAPTHDLRFEHVIFATPSFVQIVRHRSTTMDE